jgi:RNA polymerase sigma factor (sigma-70 family)
MLEDELLKWKLRRGSKEAMARTYEKYLDSMLTLAMGLLNDKSTAEDVVHDVFVSFAASVRDFRLRGSSSAYLATSVVNRVRDGRRRQRRHALCEDARCCVSAEPTSSDDAVIIAEQAPRFNEAIAVFVDPNAFADGQDG